MIPPALLKQIDGAFRKGNSQYGASWSINDEIFPATRGRFKSADSDDEYIDGFQSGAADSSHSFWVSALRTDFPPNLITDRKVNFDQGAYVTCEDDGRDYTVEEITDDIESPWLRFKLREL